MPTPTLARRPFVHRLGGGALLAALSALAPVAGAQTTAAPAAADSLQVRPGDTLWGIARDRLGNPYRWSDILTLNVGTVADPHWIYPGQRLRLPGGGEVAQAAPTTSASADSGPERNTDSVDVAPVVFAKQSDAVAPTPSVAVAPRRAAIDTARRSSEWFAVPFVDAPGAPRHAGVVVDGVDVGPESAFTTTRRFQRFDRLVLTLPDGVASTVGNTVMLVKRGPDLRGGQVLLPTGVAVVEASEGGLVTARLVRIFDVVQAGQAVVAVPTPDASPNSADARPIDSRVVWIAGSAELPTLYSALVLSAGAKEGVREGDRFELVTDVRRLTGGPTLPGTRAAVARVIRVTEFGSTALIISQEQPAVRAGMHARRLETKP